MITMKKRNKKRMGMAIGLIVFLLVSAAIFLMLPYSPTAARFHSATDGRIQAASIDPEPFSQEDIRDLPAPVQKYFQHCGYLGTPKMSYMKASLTDVTFYMSKDKTVRIDYSQVNLAEKPERFALISSSLFGIPFEGLDSFADGVGSMKGTIAKIIPLFDQRGETMNRACLVTWLAETPMLPSAMLQDFIAWEAMDDTHVKATATWNGITAQGVFTFDEDGLVRSFQTNDRVATGMDGSEQHVEWSAVYDEYRPDNGILKPAVIQSAWHYPEGDLTYFNENRAPVSIEWN